MARARTPPPRRSRRLGRWFGAAALALIASFYLQPVRSYLSTRDALEQRRADVRTLESERRALEQRVAGARSGAALAREARRIGLVKPGERLYIVRGIAAWKRAHLRAAGKD